MKKGKLTISEKGIKKVSFNKKHLFWIIPLSIVFILIFRIYVFPDRAKIHQSL